MRKLCVLCVLCGWVVAAQAAAVVYQVQPNARVSVQIAEKELNRIMVDGDRITKVVGDAEQYSIEGDAIHGFVFLKSRVEAPAVVPVTLFTEKSRVIDLSLMVKSALEPQVVTLHVPVGKAPEKLVHVNMERIVEEAVRAVKLGDLGGFTIVQLDPHSVHPDALAASMLSNRYVKIKKVDFPDDAAKYSVHVEKKPLAVARYGNTILLVEEI